VGVQVIADIDPARAWRLLQDLSLPHNYVPGIARTEIMSELTRGVGAHRRVYEEKGGFLEETVIEWREGEGFVIRLHRGDKPMAPFTRAEFCYALHPHGGDQTLIELAIVFGMPWGTPGEKLGDWFIRPVMEKRLVQIAAGMKHFYETGMAAGDEDRKRFTPSVQALPGIGKTRAGRP
jgi:hypothetical protein